MSTAVASERIEVSEPEIAVEPPRQLGCLSLEFRREAVVAERRENARQTALRCVRVALSFNERDRGYSQAPVEMADGIAGVLPALVYETS